MTKKFINPSSLFPSKQFGFSQIVTARGGTTVFLAGQVAWNADQEIGEATDLGSQTREALYNISER